MLIKSSFHFSGLMLVLGLFLSGVGLVAYSDEFEEKDITYPEDENYSKQQTPADTMAPPVEENVTVEPATVEPATVEPATVEPATVEPATVEPATVESTTVESTTVVPDRVEKFTVKVPVSEQGSRNDVEVPVAGMNKEDVENKWGEPKSFRDAVGHPPISSWVYDNFTVYFEHGHVIRSVMNPSK